MNFLPGWALIASVLTFLQVEASHAEIANTKLVVHANDSLLSKKGLLTQVLAEFKACSVEALKAGGAGTLVARMRLDLEAGRPGADVLVGIDQTLFRDTKQNFQKISAPGLKKISKQYQIANEFLPFDYGILAWIFDTQKLKTEPPKNLKDFLKSDYAKKFILEDPRTSSPGQAFISFVAETMGDGFSDYFKKLKNQWLLLAPDWEAGYGAFLNQQAPLVWSYTTSQAYHQEHGDSSQRYRAIVLAEGAPLQIEGAVILKGVSGKKLECANTFLEFLVSPAVQSKIARTQWMYPVSDDVELPESFKSLPRPKRLVRGDQAGQPAQLIRLFEKAIQ